MAGTFKVFRLKNILTLILFIAVPLLIGGLSSFLTPNTSAFYEALKKPPLSPPGAVFPIVWTILYILMGIASYLVYQKGPSLPHVRDALYFYAATLILNFLWPLVFFRFEMIFSAFWVLLILWLTVGITTAKFYRISHAAGLLMLPYFLWITYAGYLNLGFWLLNR